MKKLIFVFFCFVLTNQLFAQLYSSEALFYSESGSNKVKYVVKFDGTNSTVWLSWNDVSKVRDNLSKNSNYYENENWANKINNQKYEYCNSKSTSSRVVYRAKWENNYYSTGFGGISVQTKHEGWEYIAFSNDKSSFIRWIERFNNYDGEIKKYYYSRIPKSELLPKSINYDFLNE